MTIAKLRNYLNTLASGLIDNEHKDETTSILADCWTSLDGGDAEGMHADKLSGRVEDMTWESPLLSFKIERHGRTVNGSSRADVHQWVIDVDRGTASCFVVGHRQLTPNSPRLDVKSLARGVAALILEEKHDPKLTWLDARSVKVNLNEVIPKVGPAQTIEDRRRRFRIELGHVLESGGWCRRAKGSHLVFDRSEGE
ncbi:hypothetical protein [Dyella flagellata]|nr:hypothetical protein [Dyella flagellata]